MKIRLLSLMLLAGAAFGQTKLYVFDCGTIKGLSPTLFNFKEGEVKATEFVVPCYLIVHPKGTMMWDVGTVPDSAFKPDGSPVTQGKGTIISANKPLKIGRAHV